MSGDGVTVSPSTSRAFTSDSYYHWVRFRSSTRMPSAMPTIRAWVADVYDRFDDTLSEYADPGVTDAFEMDNRTVVIGLDRATRPQSLQAELLVLSQFLTQAGFSGTIENAPKSKPLLYPTMTSKLYSTAISGTLTLAESPARPPGPGRIHREDLDQDALHAVIDHAVGWCSVADGTIELAINLWRTRPPADQVGPLLHRLLPVNRDMVSIASVAYPNRSRSVAFTYDGRVTYAESNGHSPADTDDAVALSTSVLASIAPHLTYGFAMQTQSMVIGHTSDILFRSWPDRRWSLNWDGLRKWETIGGWDSYSVLLHGPDFDRSTSNDQYLVEDLPGGRQLLVHRAASRWIDGRNLTADELPAARHALGTTLIDFDEVRSSSRPPD